MRVACNWAIAALATFAFTLAAPAFAADEEIQVYMDEMNTPGHFGLDVHVNYVTSGDLLFDYPGQQQSLHRLRVTPEFSLGLTDDLELGGYLPLMTARDGELTVDGAKARLKFIAPRAAGQSWFWGLNFEIGKVKEKLDINP